MNSGQLTRVAFADMSDTNIDLNDDNVKQEMRGMISRRWTMRRYCYNFFKVIVAVVLVYALVMGIIAIVHLAKPDITADDRAYWTAYLIGAAITFGVLGFVSFWHWRRNKKNWKTVGVKHQKLKKVTASVPTTRTTSPSTSNGNTVELR